MYFVLDDNGNKIEGYDKQGFLACLQQAIDNGDLENIDADSAFVSKIKCCVGGGTFGVAFVTQAVYNQLRTDEELLNNTLYFITDDNTEQDLEQAVEDLQSEVATLEQAVESLGNGTQMVAQAINSVNATNVLTINDTKFPIGFDNHGSLKTSDYSIKKKVLLGSFEMTTGTGCAFLNNNPDALYNGYRIEIDVEGGAYDLASGAVEFSLGDYNRAFIELTPKYNAQVAESEVANRYYIRFQFHEGDGFIISNLKLGTNSTWSEINGQTIRIAVYGI